MIVYVDGKNRCHVSDEGNTVPVEEDFFNDKCAAFVEGYCLEMTPEGRKIYPLVDIKILLAYQRQYEEMLPEIEDADAALAELGCKY